MVTDSSACLPPAERHRGFVRVLPISILVGGLEVSDGTIAPELVYDALARDEVVKSNPPTIVDYLTAIEDGDFDAAVVLTPAAEFTVMYRNASFAARLTNRPVEVVDTRTAAAAQGLIVIAALRAAGEGGSLADVAGAARDAVDRAELIATLSSLAWIERSGRVPATALHGSGRERRHALFRFRQGSVLPLGTIDSPATAVPSVHRAWSEDGGPDADTALVFHADAPEDADRLLSALGHGEVVGFSPAMAIYTGPGCVGVAWLRGAGRA